MLWLDDSANHPSRVSVRTLYEKAAMFSEQFLDQDIPIYGKYEYKQANLNFLPYFVSQGRLRGMSGDNVDDGTKTYLSFWRS